MSNCKGYVGYTGKSQAEYQPLAYLLQGCIKHEQKLLAYLLQGCIKHEQKLLQDASTYDSVGWQQEGQSFKDDAEFAKKQKTREAVPAATGQTLTAGQTAAVVTAVASTSQKHSRSDSSSGEPHAKCVKQAVFQVYGSMDQPFSMAEAAEFQAQAL
ncbi:hypothetical protein B0H10DRAFT_1969602 [Mycena sp. CBHHK59/15]|nr:hypothetical protein B0H10DRAFT_1969602 [Mycena sp. CBHHK59/15]